MSEKKTPVHNIQLTIGMDEKNIPEKIEWTATGAEPGIHEAKAMLLGMWDEKNHSGMSIELWTKEMTVPEMNIFFYQTFLAMSDSFLRATQNKALSDDIKTFAKQFIDKVKEKG